MANSNSASANARRDGSPAGPGATTAAAVSARFVKGRARSAYPPGAPSTAHRHAPYATSIRRAAIHVRPTTSGTSRAVRARIAWAAIKAGRSKAASSLRSNANAAATPPGGGVIGQTQRLVPGAAGTTHAVPRLGITPAVLGLYLLFTLACLLAVYRVRLNAWALSLSVFMDFGLLYGLIWSFPLQYQQPPAFYLKAPTLLFCGRYDEVTPATVELAHRGIAGSEFVGIEEGSHMSQAERPEEVLSLLRDWLARAEADA